MFEINEITYYKTQDGESFETYEEAEEHNKLLMKKEIPFNEISIFNKDGDWIPVDSMLDYDKVWFFYADTDNGARFLEHFISEYISLEEDIEIKPKELYRYDESEDCWVSQSEEIEEFNARWKNLITFKEARC